TRFCTKGDGFQFLAKFAILPQNANSPLNQYVQLPAPIASPTAALVMLFAGIVLMIPAALVVMWRVAQIVAPQLTHSPKPESLSDREKRNDADH
ncbi:YbjC family protein, partial [Klebsiella pneumoniae]